VSIVWADSDINVVEIAPLSGGEINVQKTSIITEEIIVDPITMDQPTQEEWQGGTQKVSLGSKLAKINSEALNLAMVTDEFDADTFDENINTEPHIEENDEAAISESGEEKTCNLQLT
jgi:hypothetical protein